MVDWVEDQKRIKKMKKIDCILYFLKKNKEVTLSSTQIATGASFSYIRRFFSYLIKNNRMERISGVGICGVYVVLNVNCLDSSKIDQDLNDKEKNKKKKFESKKLLYEKMGGVCVKCGFSDYRALQIDHINGGGNKEIKFLRATKKHGFYHKIVLESHLKNEKKYQLLCANCNWIKRFENNE